MPNISRKETVEKVRDAIIRLAHHLPGDYLKKLRVARPAETDARAGIILDRIIDNAKVAEEHGIPLCQDTGMVVMFVDIGRDAHYAFDLEDALQTAVSEAYLRGRLRKSVVKHPLNRVNTGDNTPAVIHHTFTDGDRITVRLALKGGGSENMSRMAMLSPSDGKEGIITFVLDTVKQAGGKTCPPIVVGVGIGGNFEKAPLLAKEALLRDLNDHSPLDEDRDLENLLCEKINASGVGPMGLGGRTTCLAVKVQSHPCHIASLPVAVNLQCHSFREGTVVLP